MAIHTRIWLVILVIPNYFITALSCVHHGNIDLDFKQRKPSIPGSFMTFPSLYTLVEKIVTKGFRFSLPLWRLWRSQQESMVGSKSLDIIVWTENIEFSLASFWTGDGLTPRKYPETTRHFTAKSGAHLSLDHFARFPPTLITLMPCVIDKR